jgi:hypothetical protein
MTSGLYSVFFFANNSNAGGGLVVIKDGTVNGGDATYIYQGRFDYYGDDIKAVIDVKHYQGPVNSVMGSLKDYTLSLVGKRSPTGFELIGGIVNIPNVSLKVIGRKVADLFE